MQKVEMDSCASQIKENMLKIKNKILIMSNKGGVGKSSVTLNLALALSERNYKVGILDIDIHGPSMAKMCGQENKMPQIDGKNLIPLEIKPNLKLMSLGLIMKESELPVIWRGPLKINVLKQFLCEVLWGELDYLLVDSPPGTGDEPLSICQMIPEIKGIIVTTGQKIALLDSRKAVNFLKKVNAEILGIVENMSVLKCPQCGREINLFKSGGEKTAKEMGVKFLGRIPFDPDMLESEDEGILFLENYPGSPAATAFRKIAETL